ncbi:(dimethylallyl)adenosine tRNA methylthiotransferase MiaB [Peptoclostridium acidaminophilum DSM 3953]|uniref:tRNA-2-methylthio-N(6)-dimethylallyladenosine synthase n=1 Tax=Peptoclostridium acidaminophilum DSM 3953 TaxID=1286171 RepID=W8T4A7_PEPAC|nr:tRNA (N6-isopentenyl adenosine(37)-C2)-methylthiotransferase MiaB [Peptoclostridium acidaminophilum]AHM56594.1 (dimethylallyl)adenosine tRNA methylthiotransferase MiaB [Peptoclostridium acidaminophilum DSM 3953]
MGERKQVEISAEELEKQEYYIREVRRINDEQREKARCAPKYIILTYGCQMNEHDSEKMNFMLSQMGYIPSDNIREADIVIFNTCAVRENAELKVYGKLGHMKTIKKIKPDVKVMVCGCMMQQQHIIDEIQKSHRHVDAVFGTHNYHKLPEFVYESYSAKGTIIDVWNIDGQVVEGLRSIRKFDTKAYVNITYGCNNFCTYCIVPYTRGRERSRKPHDIIAEIRALAKDGVKEVTLLGQNVNSYGKTLDEEYTFSRLIRDINEIEGLERIRFMTSHPKDLSDELIYAMRDCDKVCNYLHLPIQSGSSRVLKKMNRHYTKEQYLTLVEKIRREIPDISFTTDIIVGFPGEMEEDFQDTLDVVRQVRYDSAFTFIYSKRNGTPAAEMSEQVDEKIKHERLERLIALVNDIGAQINETYRDKTVQILVEGPSKTDKTRLMGRTPQSKLVNFDGSDELVGKLVSVRINDPKRCSLNGIVI